MDKTFLKKTKELGNDLITPTADFKGLKPGDKWCLCANRWKQAKKYGVAPIVDIDATNKKVEKYIDKYTLYDNIEDFQNNYIPCGQNMKMVKANNKMTSLDIVSLYLFFLRITNIKKSKKLLANPINIKVVNSLIGNKVLLYYNIFNSPCINEIVVSVIDNSGFTNQYLFTLKRQWKQTNFLKKNSMFWRIVQIKLLNV